MVQNPRGGAGCAVSDGANRGMRRSERRNSRAWNRALAQAAKAVRRVAVHLRLTPNAQRQLAAALRSLRHDPALLRQATNDELAGRYGVSRRTIQYWRRQGCPFERGRVAVAAWLLERGHVPPRCRERLAEVWDRAEVGLIRRGARALERQVRRGLFRTANRVGLIQGAVGLARPGGSQVPTDEDVA